MISFFKRLFRSRSSAQKQAFSELKGAPARIRVKTYSADTGHVYQYVFRGYRTSSTGRDYLFRLMGTTPGEIQIQITDAALADCAVQLQRNISTQEQYAIAKLALFEAFDSETRSDAVQPTADTMLGYLRRLGRA